MTTRPRVKICGITRTKDRDAAVRAGADAVGFITEVPVETPRELDPDRVATLVDGVPPFVAAVLVTMPDSVQEAASLQAKIGADVIQIHGGLSPEKLGRLGDRVDAAVIAAVDADQPDIEEYAAVADAILVDSTDDRGAGGTGEPHDWSRTREHVKNLDTPIVLAGGLTPENVATAVDTVRPFAVDTATGIEHEDPSREDSTAGDGVRKDHDAMAAFIANARGGVNA